MIVVTWLPLALDLLRSPSFDHSSKPNPAVHAAQREDWDPMQETKAERDKRMDWFRKARFGMFIHWGLYSVPGGEWNGKDVPGAGEWLMYDAKIKPRDYEPLREQFNPVKFDANKWVQIAKDAGMKYIVITSKHHEGFGMWPSKQGDWNIGHTQFHRDPLKELAAACKKAGIKFCFYHSIMDWHEPDYLPRRPWDDRPTDNANFERYVTYMKAQLKELLTGYGPLGILWFDGQWEATWNHQRGIDLYRYIRRLQPGIIVNNRVDSGNGRGSDPEIGDYGTPEQTIPANGIPGKDWETCMTMNDTWGFHKTDNNWKSVETLVRNLVDIASKGGNYLLNVGPTSLGEIPDASIERLAAMGKWTKANSESLYGTSASPFPHKMPWGRVTQRPGKLYLHVWDGSAGAVELTGLQTPIKRAYLLTSARTTLPVRAGEHGPTVALPDTLPDPIDTVIVAEVAGTPSIDASAFATPAIAPAADGSFALPASAADLEGGVQVESDTHAIGFWSSGDDRVRWTVKVPTAGKYTVTFDLACEPTAEGGEFDLSAGTAVLSGMVRSTGGWRTFENRPMGTIDLPAGNVTLVMRAKRIRGGGLMNLRSLTLTPQ
jgi:alpha-L-fucosidase